MKTEAEKDQAIIQSTLTRAESELIDRAGDLELWQMGQNESEEMDDFVYRVYADAFAQDGHVPFTREEIAAIGREYFQRARVCAVRHADGTLLGTWGLILKQLEDESFMLPIEKAFGLKPALIVQKMKAANTRFLFNGWRTAIDKDALEAHSIDRSKSIFIFDFLLRGLTADFGDLTTRMLGVAEMELLVLKYHRRIGIPWVILGEPKNYWGRDRYPCSFRLSDFEAHMREHHPERALFLYGGRTAAG